MAYFNLTERARIWNSLDDNLREQVTSGKLSWEDAAELVVPIGDVELQRMREEFPTRPLATDQVVEPEAPQGEYGVRTMLDRSFGNLSAFGDTFGAGVDDANLDQVERIRQAGSQSLGQTIGSAWDARRAEPARGEPLPWYVNPITKGTIYAADALSDALSAVGEGVQTELQRAVLDDADLARHVDQNLVSLAQNVDQLEETRNYLNSLPVNPYSKAFIDEFDSGNYLRAAVAAPMAVATTLGEQAPTLLAQLGITAGTYAITKSKAATARAAALAGGVGGLSEYGSDYLSIIEQMPPEDRRNLTKVRQALELAKEAAIARTTIESLLPAGLGTIGRTVAQQVGSNLAGQVVGGALGEAAAADIMGQERTAGELALEGLADAAGVVTEASPAMRRARVEDARLRQEAVEREAAVNQAFAEQLSEVQMQERANANREVFDAEAEADRILQERAEVNRTAFEREGLLNATQTELPFGSELTADPTGNDRTPTIVDMFSGESVAATRAEQQRATNEQEARNLAAGTPNLTDEEFEVRSQRTTDARRAIDDRQQGQFENEKQRETNARRAIADAQTTLKQERQLLSTTDITKEAKRLLALESESVRRQRAGIIRDPKKLDAVVKAYERKRLPELVENVRNRRLDQVNKARDLTIAEENRQQNLDDISVENELAQRQQERDRAAAPIADDLFAGQTVPQQPLFQPVTQPAREVLTPEQELAAGQLRRQRLNEQTRPAQARAAATAEATSKAEQEAEIDAVIPQVSKALEDTATKQANLTVKKYAAEEKKALAAIIEQELSVPNDTRGIEEKKRSASVKFAAWKKANPPPAAAPAPKVDEKDPVARAKKVAEDLATQEQRKKTAAENRKLKDAIKKGATPEEAAELLTDRRLTQEEDAEARAALEDDLPGNPAAAPQGWGLVESTPNEFQYLEDAISVELKKRRPQVGPVLRMISQHPSTPQGYKWLAAKLAPIVDNLGVKLEPAGERFADGKNAGLFLPGSNSIQIRMAIPVAVLHEALHAATSNLINAPESMKTPRIAAAVEQLNATLAAINAHIESKVDVAPARLKSALKNIDELVAYSLTEGELSRYLSGIPMPGKKGSMWQSFKNAIYALFSPRTAGQFTALDAVIEAAGALVDEQEVNPGLNERALRGRKIQALFDRNRREQADYMAAPEETPDFTNPTTRREYHELVIGGKKIGPKILKEVVRNPGKALLNALTAGAIRHASTTRALERAQSSAAALTRRADKLIEAIDGSLATVAREKKQDLSKVRKQFTELTDKYEASEPGLSRKAIVSEMQALAPTATRAYLDMRRSIDDLSRAILRERLKDPTPLTEAERSIYSAIKENIGTYYTRIYATTIRDIGDKHSRQLLASYKKIVGGKEGTDVDKKNYKIVKDGIQYIRDHLLFIPDADVLEDMSNVKLNKLAKAWGIPMMEGTPDFDSAVLTEEHRDYLVKRLTEFADKNQDAREKRAYSLIEGMLLGAEGNNALADYYRGSKLDNTIVTERQHVPPAIRKLLGEYEDKFVRGMTTIVRQGEFLAKMQALNEIRNTEGGVRLLTEDQFRDGGYSQQDWKQLKGPGYGAIQDMWARSDLAERIEDSQQVTLTLGKAMALMEAQPQAPLLGALSWGLTYWQKLAGNLKALALVYNPLNAFWNFIGGPAIMLSNGNLSAKHAKRAWKTAIDLIRSQKQGGIHNEEIEKVIRAGITDSAFMGDIKASELEQLREVMEESSKTWTGQAAETGSTWWRTAKRMWKETYAMADVVWKIANFYAEEEFVTKLFKAEGREATPQQIEDMAAWRTNNTNFSYKRVPNALKMTEKLGLTYIAPYMYETLRAPIASFATGVSDIAAANNAATPEAAKLLRSHGTQRALGSILALGGMQALTYALVRAMFEAMGREPGEDEEWVEDLKVLLPGYKQESEYEYLGKAANGNPVLLELSRGDPFGPATELYATVLQGDPEAMWEKFRSMWIGNPFGTTVVQAALGVGGTNTRLEQYDQASYDAIVEAGSVLSDEHGRAIGERMAKIVDTMMPSMITRGLDPNNVPPENMPELTLLKYLGMQFPQVSADKTLEYRAMDFEASRDNVRREFYSFLEGSYNMTDEELLDRYTKLQGIESEAFEDISKTYNGMLKLGYTPQQVLSKLKEEGLTEADLYAIASGSWTQGDNGVVSESGIERNFTSAVQRAGYTEAQKAQYLANIRRLARLVQGGQIQVRE